MTEVLPPVPPQNIEAEEAILGAMLLSPGAIATASEILTARDFYRPSNGKIFSSCLQLDALGEPVDVITLIERLKETGEIEEVGGMPKLSELAGCVSNTANVGHYAHIVKEAATLRRLRDVGMEIQRLALERPGDLENLLDRSQQLVYELSDHVGSNDLERLDRTLKATWRKIVERSESGKDLLGVSTGLHSLDRLLGGLEPGQLIVIGARPSTGKTALALTIARNVAIGAALPVAFFTLEMSKTEITQRLMSMQSGVPLSRLAMGRISQQEWIRLSTATDAISKSPFYADETETPSAEFVRAQLRRLKAREPELSLAVVDYLQLMQVERSRGDRRDLEIADVTRSLKRAARQVGVPIILLSQLNRESEKRADKRPSMADLRDSGAIEQDADVVILLHRDASKQGEIIADVAKHRNGPTDEVSLGWRKDVVRFTDLEQAA